MRERRIKGERKESEKREGGRRTNRREKKWVGESHR